MAWTVQEFPLDNNRLLVMEADTHDELDRLVDKAKAKGWSPYVTGSVPSSGRSGAWMQKPAASPVPVSSAST